MEEVIKSYMGLAILMLTLTLGLNMIMVAVSARSANLQMENYVRRIEASNMAGPVIESCKSDADSRGYELCYKPIISDGDSKYGTIALTYSLGMKLIGVDRKKVITRDVN